MKLLVWRKYFCKHFHLLSSDLPKFIAVKTANDNTETEVQWKEQQRKDSRAQGDIKVSHQDREDRILKDDQSFKNPDISRALNWLKEREGENTLKISLLKFWAWATRETYHMHQIV